MIHNCFAAVLYIQIIFTTPGKTSKKLKKESASRLIFLISENKKSIRKKE
jgi:hypothetical protein